MQMRSDDSAMEQLFYQQLIGFTCKGIFLALLQTLFNLHKTVCKERITTRILDTIFRIQQSFDIDSELLWSINKGLQEQQYLHHIADLTLIFCTYCIHRSTHKDAQRARYQENVLDLWRTLIYQRLLIQAQ